MKCFVDPHKDDKSKVRQSWMGRDSPFQFGEGNRIYLKWPLCLICARYIQGINMERDPKFFPVKARGLARKNEKNQEIEHYKALFGLQFL